MLIGILELLKELFFFAGYIAEGKSFPKPLTPQEEAKYLELLQKGDDEAKKTLIEKNLRLVAHVAKKYDSLMIEGDDLISIGTIGLIKAINTFNQDKGTQLATYAARCIENEILMAIRATKKIKSEISLNDPIGIDKEGNEITLIDILSSKNDSVVDQVFLKIQIEKLYHVISKVLTKREKVVIELRYGINTEYSYTQREIAQRLNISRSYVSRIEKKALGKLLKELEKKK
jgi:RNA polymerase sporulation-specific sigma factor